MTICYYPPTKQEEVAPQIVNNEVKLYSSSLPLLVAPAIMVLNNIMKMTISVGWVIVILGLIQALIRFARSRNRDEFIGEMKRVSGAALIMWMLPYIPMFIDTIAHHVGGTICGGFDMMISR